MYIQDENDGYIKCGINGMIVAKIIDGKEDESKQIMVRQGLEKKKVLRNIKMDLPGIDKKCGIDPENDDISVFGMLNDEDIAFKHREWLPSDFSHKEEELPDVEVGEEE